jgi:hypothetical protein
MNTNTPLRCLVFWLGSAWALGPGMAPGAGGPAVALPVQGAASGKIVILIAAKDLRRPRSDEILRCAQNDSTPWPTAMSPFAPGAGKGPAVHLPAEALLARAVAPDGQAYLIAPDAEAMKDTSGRPVGKVLLFFPERTGATVSFTLPVPADGYYRVAGNHVFGCWSQGRYGLYHVAADGVALPGMHHGWYGNSGPPQHWPKAKTHLAEVDWGVVYLRGPEVRLTFQPAGDGLLGIQSLSLSPVAADKLKAEDRARRIPPRPVIADAAAPPAVSSCTVTDAGDLKWVIPVWPAVGREGDRSMFSAIVDSSRGRSSPKNGPVPGRPAIVANAKTIDQDQLGWKNPPPESDADLSAEVQLAWDEENLCLVAHVTDDQLAPTAGQKRWGSPFAYDGVVAVITPPVWLTSGPRATGPVGEQVTFGLSFYSPETGPRPLPAGSHYVAVKMARGYDVEAAITFAALGFRPAVGDRLPLMLILVDHDPQKPAPQRFHQYGLPTRGADPRHVAQARLLSAEGWGADLVLDAGSVPAGGTIHCVGTIDVFSRPVTMAGLELVSMPGGQPIQRIPCVKTLAPGRRYQLQGTVQLPPELPPGRYDLRWSIVPGPG